LLVVRDDGRVTQSFSFRIRSTMAALRRASIRCSSIWMVHRRMFGRASVNGPETPGDDPRGRLQRCAGQHTEAAAAGSSADFRLCGMRTFPTVRSAPSLHSDRGQRSPGSRACPHIGGILPKGKWKELDGAARCAPRERQLRAGCPLITFSLPTWCAIDAPAKSGLGLITMNPVEL